MFVLSCDITIGDNRLTQVTEVKIEKSWRNLDDKAMIKLPRASKLLEKEFKVGDPVTITLAYDGVYTGIEFEGYLKTIKPQIPLELELEDPTWLFRQTGVEKVWEQSTTVKDIVKYIVAQVNANGDHRPVTLDPEIDEINLRNYRIPPMSAAEAINKLKEYYGLAAYFTGHKIYVGKAYRAVGEPVKYDMALNVIKNNLTFRKAEDVKVRVKATSVLPDNRRLTTELGDAAGDQRSLFFYNVDNEKELKELAQSKLDKLKFNGYEGNISTFLIPLAAPGMTAEITDPEHPELKNGSYVIDSVTTTFGSNGARRKVELGALVGIENE